MEAFHLMSRCKIAIGSELEVSPRVLLKNEQ